MIRILILSQVITCIGGKTPPFLVPSSSLKRVHQWCAKVSHRDRTTSRQCDLDAKLDVSYHRPHWHTSDEPLSGVDKYEINYYYLPDDGADPSSRRSRSPYQGC